MLDQTSDLIGLLYLGVDFYKLKPIIHGCLGIWNFLRKCSTRYFTGSLLLFFYDFYYDYDDYH